MDELKVIYLPLSELTPDDKNAKLHPADQVEQIKESIKTFKMCDPIGIAGKNNLIIEGHGRYLALTELGVKNAPCIRLDHLDTEEKRKAYALIHNKTTMNSGFDIELLDMALSEIETIDMGVYGFEQIAEDNDIAVESDYNEGYNITIKCVDLKEAQAVAKLLNVEFDYTRQKLSVKAEDIL